MNYSQLQNLLDKKRMLVKEVYEKLGMTYDGFRNSIERQTLPLKRVMPLCEILEITPNQFFGVEDLQKTVNNTAVQVGGRSNIMQYERKSLDIMERQLKEKDKQIESLLSLLHKQNI